MADYQVHVNLSAVVEVNADDDYTDEWGGLLDPARQEGIYESEDRDEILELLAYNAVVNNQRDARRIDGWAGIPKGLLTMRTTDEDFYVTHIEET